MQRQPPPKEAFAMVNPHSRGMPFRGSLTKLLIHAKSGTEMSSALFVLYGSSKLQC